MQWHIPCHARLDWEGNETSKEDSNPRTANWFGRSRIGRILNNSSISRLFRSRSHSAGATSEGSPELTEYIENLEKAIYAIKSRGIGTEHIKIGFTSPLSICNDVMKNVIFHTLEEYESTIRLVKYLFLRWRSRVQSKTCTWLGSSFKWLS